jgi:hypothetical protein
VSRVGQEKARKRIYPKPDIFFKRAGNSSPPSYSNRQLNRGSGVFWRGSFGSFFGFRQKFDFIRNETLPNNKNLGYNFKQCVVIKFLFHFQILPLPAFFWFWSIGGLLACFLVFWRFSNKDKFDFKGN